MQLFQPDLMAGLNVKSTLADKDDANSALRSVAVNASSKKAIALSLGIANNKENSDRIEAEGLKRNDQLMQLAVKELVSRATSGEWTGKLAKISTNKKGSEQTFTVSLKSCNRLGILPSREQVIKYLARNAKTDDEQVAILDEAAAVAAEGKSPIDLKVVEA